MDRTFCRTSFVKSCVTGSVKPNNTMIPTVPWPTQTERGDQTALQDGQVVFGQATNSAQQRSSTTRNQGWPLPLPSADGSRRVDRSGGSMGVLGEAFRTLWVRRKPNHVAQMTSSATNLSSRFTSGPTDEIIFEWLVQFLPHSDGYMDRLPICCSVVGCCTRSCSRSSHSRALQHANFTRLISSRC